MAKILLTSSNIMKFVNQETGDLILTSQMILTPGAKDTCRNHKITIFYQEEQEDTKVEAAKKVSSPLKNSKEVDLDLPQDMPLDHVIKQILRKQFNIVSEVEVWNITNKVLEHINNI